MPNLKKICEHVTSRWRSRVFNAERRDLRWVSVGLRCADPSERGRKEGFTRQGVCVQRAGKNTDWVSGWDWETHRERGPRRYIYWRRERSCETQLRLKWAQSCIIDTHSLDTRSNESGHNARKQKRKKGKMVNGCMCMSVRRVCVLRRGWGIRPSNISWGTNRKADGDFFFPFKDDQSGKKAPQCSEWHKKQLYSHACKNADYYVKRRTF